MTVVPEMDLPTKIATLLSSGSHFVGGKEAGPFLAEMEDSLSDLDALDISSELPSPVSMRFPSPLAYARFAEGLHLELLELEENLPEAERTQEFWGSAFEAALGNMVYTMCMENGLDLDAEGGQAYCMKATSNEICMYNISRLDKALLGKKNAPSQTARVK